ncbi:MAG: hypothetical protein JWO95_2888 [Verrucomicrobiales bacterium]|nr:hypothetical protein [Verrucomicrobiales bacterium]
MKPFHLALAFWLATVTHGLASAYSDFTAGIAARNRDDIAESIRLLSSAIASADLPAHLRPVAYFDRGTAYLDGQKV